MITYLQIENVAVIEKAELEFHPGMNVLTGETGAGKSIVIDALHCVTGGRTGRDLVRTNAPYAAVTAVFQQSFDDNWYEANGIERDDSGELLLYRKITPDGKNSCRVNGRTVSITQLKAIGTDLVDIHGQNDGRKLLDENNHRYYLDSFAHTENLLADYKACFQSLRDLQKQWKALDMDEGEKARRADMLRYQIEEILRANPQPGEYEELTQRRDLMKNSAKLSDSLSSACRALMGSERSDGAITLLEEAEREVDYCGRFSDSFQAHAGKLRDAAFLLEDVAEELRGLKDQLDFSPEEMDRMDERIGQLKRLFKKYGATEAEVLESLEASQRELEELDWSDEAKAKLEKKIATAKKEAEKKAKLLSAARQKGAEQLEARILSELKQLNMKSVVFTVAIETVELGSDGSDEISFLMSANPGEKPGRINRIASGGELSRIMLAMKNVLAENEPTGTMVFDEIDTGVSGVAAQRVGEKLWQLGTCRQVLCVTHLPQIAVMADTQYLVEKKQGESSTQTNVLELDYEGRKKELARLAGGEHITELTLESSADQLAAAEGFKALTKADSKVMIH
ncbi:MAG: DNA repair protein RecN [Oscillospiraceae bacterium]|nr:DNA repair protein RecN [Oscillospiraceae bacterium]